LQQRHCAKFALGIQYIAKDEMPYIEMEKAFKKAINILSAEMV
jgi:hypothetical protein